MIRKTDIEALIALFNRWPQTAETRAWMDRFIDDLAQLLPPEEKTIENVPEKAAENVPAAPEESESDEATPEEDVQSVKPLRPPPLGGY